MTEEARRRRNRDDFCAVRSTKMRGRGGENEYSDDNRRDERRGMAMSVCAQQCFKR
jgi:hypothetical protein